MSEALNIKFHSFNFKACNVYQVKYREKQNFITNFFPAFKCSTTKINTQMKK